MYLTMAHPHVKQASASINADFQNLMMPDKDVTYPQEDYSTTELGNTAGVDFLLEQKLNPEYVSHLSRYSYSKVVDDPTIASREVLE